MIPIPCPIPFERLPALAAEYGLQILQVIADENLELTLVVQTSTGESIWCTDWEHLTMPQANQALKKILSTLYQSAAQTPGRPVRRELNGGLRIDLLIGNQDGLTKLQLSRPHTWPSATEYAVVLNAMPFDLPLDLEPERQVYANRYYLKCQWRTIK
jgi:hypothetical protein